MPAVKTWSFFCVHVQKRVCFFLYYTEDIEELEREKKELERVMKELGVRIRDLTDEIAKMSGNASRGTIGLGLLSRESVETGEENKDENEGEVDVEALLKEVDVKDTALIFADPNSWARFLGFAKDY